MRPFHILSFLILLCWQTKTIAQQHNFANYSVAEGLAQSQIPTMLEDRQGYLWLGTKGGGLCRFDGQSFTTFTTQHGLVSNYIQTIYEAKNGILWISTSNGINQLKDSKFINFNKNKNLIVNAFLEDSKGLLWLATNQGVYLFENDQFIDFFSQKGITKKEVFHTLYEDAKGQIWLGGKNGLFKIKDNTIEEIKQQNGAACTDILSIHEPKNELIWIATYNQGIYLSDGDKILRHLTISDQLPSNKIQTITSDKTGNVWLGSANKGVAIWHPKTLEYTILTNQNGLPNNNVQCILEDTWGNIWLGTSGGGLSKYSGQQFEHFNKTNGLKGDYIQAIAEGKNQELWVATSNNGIQTYKNERFQNFGENSDLLNTSCQALFTDQFNHLWIGTTDKGLTVFLDSLFLTFTKENGLASNTIIAISEDQLGNIWAASETGGITKIEWNDTIPSQSILTTFSTKNGLPSNAINTLHVDRQNSVWIATNNGIALLKNDKIIKVFNSNTKKLKDNNIRSLAEDQRGNLWYGTAGRGIGSIRIYENGFPIKNTYPNLTSGNIKLLKTDAKNNLWVGTEKGLDYLKLDEASKILTINHFGKTDGFKGIETTQNVVLEDNENNLWFGTVNGLTKYNKSFQKGKEYPPKLTIQNIQLAEQNIQETIYKRAFNNWATLKLPYDQNNINFKVAATHLSYPNDLLYQWKLEGVNKDWSVSTTQNEAKYPFLPVGKYNLKIRATTAKGKVFSETLAFPFEIAHPFWQTWWFRLGAVLAGISAISLFIKWRINRVRKNAQQIQNKLELDKKLLELEQKALQLQMNPHFIFNALNSIQGSINPNDIKMARLQLAKFSKLMRATLENARTDTIPLEEEILMLSNYLSLEQFSNGNTFDYEIKVAENIDSETVYLPTMILQPFVENAIIHGVLHLETRGKINVNFTRIGKRLNCSIEDNGIGRTKAKALKSQIAQQHKSAALEITRERLDLMRNGKAAKNSLQIIDVVDSDGQALGTRVEIILPIEED